MFSRVANLAAWPVVIALETYGHVHRERESKSTTLVAHSPSKTFWVRRELDDNDDGQRDAQQQVSLQIAS